ncbi:hypothetical protein GLYMA_19G077900v4 [Glycine max]|uniref:Uncharacterized protein n=1 Tax=Glycine max TaxID=3847 RepID=A0A0R0EJC6_SOYBN|nr:hypothetical protein GLYMA_19G077900v4 [Glycine max]
MISCYFFDYKGKHKFYFKNNFKMEDDKCDKEMCTAFCYYHSVCLKYNRPSLFIDSYLTAIK